MDDQWKQIPLWKKLLGGVGLIIIVVIGLFIYKTFSHCQGTTAEGNPCKNKPTKGSIYCYQHK